MANRPMRLCSYPGCPALVYSGRCEKHTIKRDDKEYDRRRGSSTARGYNWEWQQFRAHYLRRHPLCVKCEEQGNITPATMIHHKTALRDGGSKYDEDNLVALCFDCHEIVEGRKRTLGGM